MLYCFNFKEDVCDLNENKKEKGINLSMYLLILANFVYIIKLLIRLLMIVNFL